MVIDSVEVEVGGDVDIIQHIGSYRLTHYCFHIHGVEKNFAISAFTILSFTLLKYANQPLMEAVMRLMGFSRAIA
jgi:hypothetical protein